MICFDLAVDQIAQSGLSSLKVIYYSAHLFRVNTAGLIRSMSRKGCLSDNAAYESYFGKLKMKCIMGVNGRALRQKSSCYMRTLISDGIKSGV